MSILLEALRKSEKDRTKVETPTVHSGEPRVPVSNSPRIGPLALLLILAFISYGTPVVDARPTESGNLDSNSPANDSPHKPGIPVGTLQQVAGNVPQQKPANVSKAESQGSKRSSAPQAKNEAGKMPAAKITAPRKSIPVSYSELPDSIRAKLPEVKYRNLVYKNNPENRYVIINGQPRVEGEWFAPAAGAPGVKLKEIRRDSIILEHKIYLFYGEKEPPPIGYWEMSDSIRAKIPEIKFSLLVYDIEPAERFVSINGQRRVEGEWFVPAEGVPGVKLVEIRPDGIMLEHNRHQFFVER